MQTFILPIQPRTRAVKRLIDYVYGLAQDKAWQVDVKLFRKSRSIQQNRYLFGVAYELLADATGYDIDDIHQYLCGTRWGWREKKVPRKPGSSGIEQVPVRTTTTDEEGRRDVLSWADFADYTEFVIRFGSEHGVVIPPPDPELRKS